MAYATEADLVPTYLATAPTQVELKLERASRTVDQALLTAVYDVDEDGLPTDPDVQEALRTATCEQVTAWEALGEDGTGAASSWDDVQIGSVRLARRSQTGAGGSGSAATRLAPQAWAALQQAGLTGHEPYTFRTC